MFAKLYETTEHGQILVMLDSTEDGEPIIKYCCQPAGLGICYAQSPPFENSERGWFIAEQTFKDETKKSAIELVEVVILAALDEMEVVEIPYDQQHQQKHNHTIH
jgi:hypothetical protein